MKLRKRSSPVNGRRMPAKAKRRQISQRTRTPSATRSNAEVRRRKTRRRREETWDTIVGFKVAVRKTRKNPGRTMITRTRGARRQRRSRPEVGAPARVEAAKRLTERKTQQLHRRAVVFLHAAVISAVCEINY